jgi:hypothetical protein
MEDTISQIVTEYFMLSLVARQTIDRLKGENKENTLAYTRVKDHLEICDKIADNGVKCLITEDYNNFISELKKLGFHHTANLIQEKQNLLVV